MTHESYTESLSRYYEELRANPQLIEQHALENFFSALSEFLREESQGFLPSDLIATDL